MTQVQNNYRNRKLLFRFTASVILITSLLSTSRAQFETDSFDYEIGAAAGFSTGYGLSFRYWPEKWGLQATFGPYYDSNGPMISLGVAGMRLIEDNGWSRFFIYLGNHLHLNRTEEYDYTSETYQTNPVNTYIIGAGPGFEFLIRRRLGINLMFGVAAYIGNDDWFMMHLTGETGLFYRF